VIQVPYVVRNQTRFAHAYSAWLLLPGSFLLAGAAAMCIFGALVEFPLIPWTMWVPLTGGGLLWMAALVLVRSHSH
jgi:hypothetical protein